MNPFLPSPAGGEKKKDVSEFKIRANFLVKDIKPSLLALGDKKQTGLFNPGTATNLGKRKL